MNNDAANSRPGKNARYLALLGALCLVAAAAASGHEDQPAVAAPSGPAGNLRQVLMSRDLPDLPGKRATVITLDYAPAGTSPPHFHPGSVFAYVLQGSVVSQLGDENPVIYSKGQFWYESPKQPHRVSRNASATERARLLVMLLADADEPVTVPLK